VFNLDEKSKSYYIQFEDAEIDKITITNERDLMDAFECAEQEQRQSLKIFVVAGSVADTHDLSTPTQETTIPSETKTNECGESERCDWKPAIVEFLLDENIRVLLPELVRRVIQVLREKATNGEEASLAVVVPLVLKEKTFESIVRHQLYLKYADCVLPLLLSQASCFTHILLNLNEEAVGDWVAEMVNLAVASFAEGKDNGLWGMHMNMWCEEEQSGETIHFGVTCDICGVSPIRGIRYKCAVCPNYDLCEKCEAGGQHHVGHALLKINRPMCRRQAGRHHFAGLEEVVARRPCFRRPHEGGPHHGGRHHGRSHMRPPCWMRFLSPGMPLWGEEQRCEQREGWGWERRCRAKDGKRHWRCSRKMEKATEDKVEEKEFDSGVTIRCVCAANLVKMTPMEAYGRNQVMCDWCDASCAQDRFVYHCPVKNSKHPSGYDVCLRCASSIPQEKSAPEEPKEKEKEKEKPTEKINETETEKEKEKENVVPDPFDQFQYANEARSLVEMGFTDKERIMYLLVNKKGDLSQVILELLTQ